MSRRLARNLLAACGGVALAALLAACSGDQAKPTPLEPNEAKIAGHQVWKIGLSGFEPEAVLPVGANFVVAASNGTVLSVDAASGHENWRADAGSRLSTGIGADARFAAVVTRDDELVVFDNGKRTWTAKLPSDVATAPFVGGERVFVMGVDRRVTAFDAISGQKIWVYDRPGDALTLSQAGVLTAWKDTLLVGQGARLTALDPLKGTQRWEVPVATPRGTNEVERLADLVGPATRVGDVFCIRAFENGVGCIDAQRATALWSINGGGRQAVGADDDYVFAGDASDRLSARRRSNGESVWLSDKFQNRRLSGMLSVGKVVVFGDYQGWVHFLDRETGAPLLRLPTDGSQVIGAPVRNGNTLVVTTKDGGLYAFRPE